MNVGDHDNFRADVRQCIAATKGEPDPAEIVEEIHAEILERLPQRRNKRGVNRVLRLLDELKPGGSDG